MKQLLKNKHWDIQKEYDIDKILYLLIDRPYYINHWNDFIWKCKRNNGVWRRDYNLPVSIANNGLIKWWKHNSENIV